MSSAATAAIFIQRSIECYISTMGHTFILLLLTALTFTGSMAFAADQAPAAASDQAEPVVKTLVWPDGTRYVGGVVDGKRSGKGTIFWKDGTRFVGTFKNDMRNGPGTMILPDGTVYTGYFEDDELVEHPDQRRDEPAAPTVAGEINAQPEPAEAEAPMLEPVTEITDDVKARLQETVDLWAAAWSEQNVVQYLDYYSEDFDVPDAQDSRQSWEVLRRSRLTRPDRIDIDIEFRRFELVEPDVVDVTFKQTYRSDIYADVTIKTLRLRKEGPAWKILLERTR